MPRPDNQLERTVLSWSRTSLAALVLAGVSIKAGLRNDDAATLVAGAFATVAAAALYLGGRFRSARPIAAGRYGAPGAMWLVSGTCLAAQCAALVAIGLQLSR